MDQTSSSSKQRQLAEEQARSCAAQLRELMACKLPRVLATACPIIRRGDTAGARKPSRGSYASATASKKPQQETAQRLSQRLDLDHIPEDEQVAEGQASLRSTLRRCMKSWYVGRFPLPRSSFPAKHSGVSESKVDAALALHKAGRTKSGVSRGQQIYVDSC